MLAETPALRAMHWSDLPAVHAMEVECFRHDPWTVEAFWSELAQVPDTRWYAVMCVGQEIVGYAGVMVVGADADVQTIAVAPKVQGQGLGAALLQALHDHARQRGASRIFLEVRDDNASALALYDTHGYERTGVRTNYYGPGASAIVMMKSLAGAS
jgi:ribosomal-protein-alanine N-acetyltransferase